MPSHQRLSSACQKIVRYSASGLALIHPHLIRALKLTGAQTAIVDLLNATPYPNELSNHPHLSTALLSLRGNFEQILKAEGFRISEITEAKLVFKTDGLYLDEYRCECHALLACTSKLKFFAAVNRAGIPISPDQLAFMDPR